MGNRSSTGKKFILLLTLVALLLQQLALVLCVAPAPEHTAADQYSSRRTCNATIGECDAKEEDMMMESEISRRFLADQKVISFHVLAKNLPACSAKAAGSRYESCGLAAAANKYSKGCSKFKLCRGGT